MIGSTRAAQYFRSRVKATNVVPMEMFYMTSAQISGCTIPSGVLVYNTTTNKLYLGVGGTDGKLITSAT